VVCVVGVGGRGERERGEEGGKERGGNGGGGGLIKIQVNSKHQTASLCDMAICYSKTNI